VKNVTVEVDNGKESSGSPQVRIKWMDPPYPNGLVVLYEIELARVDVAYVSLLPFADVDEFVFGSL
jgi:hypothetical protein